jgi:imidazole glycerol-phosphate synthase subunit HisH
MSVIQWRLIIKERPLQLAIIDYKMSNLFSVERACESVGMMPVITTDKNIIKNADAVLLPGVGAFGAAMDNLNKLDLVSPIIDFIDTGKPFMGICLGMQLLMTESEEFGNHRGLDVIKGTVIKFPSKNNDGLKYKVPQVGWNHIRIPTLRKKDRWNKTPLVTIPDGEYMYFVHSYYIIPENAEDILTVTNYSTQYASSVVKDNIFGFQFHPEKSGKRGIEIYNNFKKIIEYRRNM